jgi:hypothetical protein
MSDAHDPEPILPLLANGHDGACAVRLAFKDTQPVVPFRGRAVRHLVGGDRAAGRAQRRRQAGPRRPGLATVSRVELQLRIGDRTGEFLIFAVTPPKLATEAEQSRQIAEVTLE